MYLASHTVALNIASRACQGPVLTPLVMCLDLYNYVDIEKLCSTWQCEFQTRPWLNSKSTGLKSALLLVVEGFILRFALKVRLEVNFI